MNFSPNQDESVSVKTKAISTCNQRGCRNPTGTFNANTAFTLYPLSLLDTFTLDLLPLPSHLHLGLAFSTQPPSHWTCFLRSTTFTIYYYFYTLNNTQAALLMKKMTEDQKICKELSSCLQINSAR